MRFNIRWMALALACLASAALSLGQQKPIVRPGIKDVQAPMIDLKPVATFQLGGTPDWLAISGDAIWVANSKFKAVQRINPIDASIVAKIEFQAEPCSGLTFAFGTLWVGLCGKPASLARVDPATKSLPSCRLGRATAKVASPKPIIPSGSFPINPPRSSPL